MPMALTLHAYLYLGNGNGNDIHTLQVATDLDFLANVRPVVSWLGFNMERNPLIVPMSLDFRVPTPGPKALRKAWEPSHNTFHSIGGNTNASAVPATIREDYDDNAGT